MSSLHQLLQEKLGLVEEITSVQGGDVGTSFRIVSQNREYFCKVYKESDHQEMILSEIDGLAHLSEAVDVPEVIDSFFTDGFSGLIMEYIDSAVSLPEAGGESVARLHQFEGREFGYARSSFIGPIRIYNTRSDSWADFWWEHRILPLYHNVIAEANDAIRKGMKWIEQNRDELFPKESPRLLHGDLWSGNFIYRKSGSPCFIDPSVYYGHREMDIGMMLLFGGFRDELIAYLDICPLEKGWEKRMFWSQLYPLMVHWCLFGGAYAMRIEQGFRERGITT